MTKPCNPKCLLAGTILGMVIITTARYLKSLTKPKLELNPYRFRLHTLENVNFLGAVRDAESLPKKANMNDAYLIGKQLWVFDGKIFSMASEQF